MSNWWNSGNDLALVEAILRKVREDESELSTTFSSHLIGAARVVGLTDDEIMNAFESDRCLTIYEP